MIDGRKVSSDYFSLFVHEPPRFLTPSHWSTNRTTGPTSSCSPSCCSATQSSRRPPTRPAEIAELPFIADIVTMAMKIISDYVITENYQINNIATWNLSQFLLFCAVIWTGLEIMQQYVPMLFQFLGHPKLIEVRGKHLDKFESLDLLFIFVNKLLTIAFVYHVIQATYFVPSIKWDPSDVTLLNTVGSYIAFFIFYDFFYMWFHRILHLRSLYPLIHKHHHRQKAPSRGNLDAINVHPIEYLIGEYLHLVTICVIPCHIYTVIAFIVTGGILASLNHTRLDLNIPLGIYSVKAHDIHHRLPESNYAQYTMYWDKIHGSYRSYDKTLESNGTEKTD